MITNELSSFQAFESKKIIYKKYRIFHNQMLVKKITDLFGRAPDMRVGVVFVGVK